MMSASRSTSRPLSRGSGPLGVLRRRAARRAVLAVLLLTQLPLVAALMLAALNPGSDHELQARYDRGRIEVVLHHVAKPQAGHRHTGLESVLVNGESGEPGGGHPDHVLAFGSSAPQEKADGGVLPEGSPVADAVAASPIRVPRPAVRHAACPVPCRVAPSPPGGWRRGVVMRL